MKSNLLASMCAAFSITIASCQKAPPSVPESVTNVAPSAAASEAAANSDTSVATPPVALPPAVDLSPPVVAAPVPKRLVIPVGTRLVVKLDTALGSNSSAAGESFTGTLVKGIRVQGVEAISAQSVVVGKVIDAKAAGKFSGASSLGIRLESLATHAVLTDTFSQHVDGKGKRSALIIGGSAVAGALLGGLAGHGKGAIIGGAAGGGLGTLGAAQTGNSHDITLPEGTVVTFKLRHSLTLN